MKFNVKESLNYHLLLDADWLRKKYIDENMSIQKIADSIESKYHAVRSALLKANIQMKPQRIYGHVNYPNRKKENHPSWKGGKPKCLGCGKQVSNYDRFRCWDCYTKANRGENHTNYKLEKTSPQNVIIRNSEEYRNWRNAVFAKYDYRCGICGIRTKTLNAHHLDSFHAFPEKRFEINNGFCLCSNHHRMFHKQYGIRNNTQSQFLEYQSLITKELQNGFAHNCN
jgi:predicted restriction endonuclease